MFCACIPGMREAQSGHWVCILSRSREYSRHHFHNTPTGILAPVALARKILSILWHLLVNR